MGLTELFERGILLVRRARNGDWSELNKLEFLGENDEEMDKNIVDNSYSYFTFVCGNVLFYRDASFHGVYSIGYLWRYFKSER